MKEQKLVITGMGAVTPIGIGVDAYWSALVEGQCGVGKITRFDASELPVQIAAELKDFDPAAYMPKTLARTMDPFMQFAFVAAEEALKNSELSIESESDRIGIVMGTAMDGVTTVAQTQAAFDTGKRVGPRFVPMTIGNIAAAQISIAHGIHGPSLTLNTACSAGGDAIMTAAMLLRSGEADAVLAVGGESILCPIVVSGLSQAKALSRRNDDPEQACRPFDLDRDGFVIGEGRRRSPDRDRGACTRPRRKNPRRTRRLREYLGCTPRYRALPGRRRRFPLHGSWRSRGPACSRPILAISTRTAHPRRSATRPKHWRSRPCSAAAKAHRR